MYFKNNTKQRLRSIQGLRSFKDTLPTNIKKIINKRGHIFSEILNNWKFLVGESLFKVCFPKSFKISNKFGVSTLLIMVQRGHEIDLEYSKKEIINKINEFFGNIVIQKIKFTTFEEERKQVIQVISDKTEKKTVTRKTYHEKIESVKNEKIKKSLIELTKVFREK